MDVFELVPEREFPALDFRQNPVQALRDVAGVLSADDRLLGEHCGMCLARSNILSKQVLIDLYRGIDVFEQRVGGLPEATAPHFVDHGRLAPETVP